MMQNGVPLEALNMVYVPFVGFMIYLNLDVEAVIVLSVLLGVDMVTGVWKTISLGEKPKSWRFANGIVSKIVLLMIPFVLAIAGKGVHLDLTPLVYVCMNALILSEVYSIFGNIYTIRTKEEVEEFDVVSLILKKVREFINKALHDK